MAEIIKLLQHTIASKASDLHISTGSPIMLRIHGSMNKIDDNPASEEVVNRLVNQVLTPDQRTLFEKDREIDFSLDIADVGRFRVNVFNQRQGLGAVFRVIPHHILTMKELRLPSVISKLLELEIGLILVTGPTGSGKSTTLASMVDHINQNRAGHIITIEDPVEFLHHTQQCIVNQREVGTNTHSFANALRSALREDPDFVLVGELRDLETISLALTAAETGHLVFGTLHTSSAPKTITRIIDVFPAGEQDRIQVQLSESLQAVIAQRLYPRCDEPGRVAAYEILIATQAVRNLIREKKIFQIESIIQTSRQMGMQNMEQAKRKLVLEGLLSPKYLEERMTLY
ncbi:type IV pilus twitching motility protein PilT [candidate division WOR-3 bacterium]|nr:type IV pilus twitching motility protein PilT [candidate division WOR-3 bacterium]